VEQIRQPLYTQLSDGSIRNSYEIKLNNKLTAPMTVGIVSRVCRRDSWTWTAWSGSTLEPQERIKLLARVQIPPDRRKRRVRR
jgi:hypothetical protein